MYRPSGRARRLFCRVIFPGKRSRRKASRYGIGPYSSTGGVAAKGGVYGGAGLRDDASIVPYTGLRCRKIAVSRLAAGPVRFAGNGLDRSAGPCAAATGPIWNRPLRRCGRGCGHAAAFMAGRGLRRDEGIPPYGCFVGFASRERRPLLTRDPSVGADSISARGVGGGAKRADRESAPTADVDRNSSATSAAGTFAPVVPRKGGCGKCGIVVSRTKNIRPQAEAAGVYFTGYWARCQVFCRPAVRAI